MSRCYEYAVTMKGVNPDKAKEIIEEMSESAHLDEHNGIASVGGNTNLRGGESEMEAHERISKAIKGEFPKALVRTRWTNLDEIPYNEYGDEID